VPTEAIVKATSSHRRVRHRRRRRAVIARSEASRAIDIEEFVDLADIDPIFYDSAYYVAPTRRR